MSLSDYPTLFTETIASANEPSSLVYVEDLVEGILASGKAMQANFIRSYNGHSFPTSKLASISWNRIGVLSGCIYSRVHLNNAVEVTGGKEHYWKFCAELTGDPTTGTSYHVLKKMMDKAPIGSVYRDGKFTNLRNLNEYVKVNSHTWVYNGSISLIEPRADDTRARVPIGLKDVVADRLRLLQDPVFEVMFLIAMENIVKMYDFLFAVNPLQPHKRSIRKDMNPKTFPKIDMSIRPLIQKKFQ